MAKLPDVRVPKLITASAVQAVRAAISDAVRLGLLWRLRPGTVGGSVAAQPEGVPVRIDGDSSTIYARSMTGSVLPGQRVWCIQVPPAGIYVLGIIGDRRGQLIQSGNTSVTPVTEVLPAGTPYDASIWTGSTAVTFDTVFDAAPDIVVTAVSTVPGTVIEATQSGGTTTGFTARVARANTTATTIHWVAVGTSGA